MLVGHGDLRPMLTRMSADLGLDEWVRFTGRVPDDEVVALLSVADLCVAPDPKDALNDVSTMNKLVEYVALGKPIVAFDLCEARISCADAAVYATPTDPIDFARHVIDLLAAPERRRQMGAIARARFETSLAWEYQAGVLVTLYRGLIGEPS